jgi:hypothetical protein
MPDKHRKRPRDPNQLGKFIVDIATGEVRVLSSIRQKRRTVPADVLRATCVKSLGSGGMIPPMKELGSE